MVLSFHVLLTTPTYLFLPLYDVCQVPIQRAKSNQNPASLLCKLRLIIKFLFCFYISHCITYNPIYYRLFISFSLDRVSFLCFVLHAISTQLFETKPLPILLQYKYFFDESIYIINKTGFSIGILLAEFFLELHQLCQKFPDFYCC